MLSLCRITIIIFAINILLMSYTGYVFFINFDKSSDLRTHTNSIQTESYESNIDEELNQWGDELNVDDNDIKSTKVLNNYTNSTTIEIWSKAAIGLYLWQHIIKGKIDKTFDNNVYMYGFKRINNYKLKFRSGPLLTINSLEESLNTENLILVLNGRDIEKVEIAINWLKAVNNKVGKTLRNVGLVLLGDEQCHNNWINPYLYSNGGVIKFVLIVYDWKQVDNSVIYQWPLGVATYRNFPNPDLNKLNLQITRPYVCNLMATIYPDSSRIQLLHILENENYKNICFIKPRLQWQPKESRDSLNLYLEALRLSDLTLSPIGMNHECYRIYEAMAFGSVPVIEQNLNHVIKSSCDPNKAFRLLKQNNAPVIYVTNWTLQLPTILQNELKLSQEFKIQRRIQLIKWYQNFKTILRNRFIYLINQKFV